MITTIIVAVSENNVIGKDNDLVWHLPDDLKFFKEKTVGHHVVMGRKNYLSIPEKYRPLANRTNIVLTRNSNFVAPGCIVLNDIVAAKNYAEHAGEEELFVVGGGQIFELALQIGIVDKMLITKIHEKFEGDTFFPFFDEKKWKLTSEKYHGKDEKHVCAFSFCTYEKIG